MEHFSFSSITSFILEPALNTSAFRIRSSKQACSVHFFPPVMEGFGQIALIYLPSVSCLPLFLSLPADIDECQVHNGGCQHRCVNTRGSYYCECHPGSRLHVDGRTCLGEEVIFRRPVDLWSLILSLVARLCLDQHKHSKTHTVENSNAHVDVSLLCLTLLSSGPWGGGVWGVLIPAGRNAHSLFCHLDPINVFLGSSRNVASWGGANAAAGSPPLIPREAVVCDRQISHGEMSDHRDNSKSTSGQSLRQSPSVRVHTCLLIITLPRADLQTLGWSQTELQARCASHTLGPPLSYSELEEPSSRDRWVLKSL